MEDHDKIRWWMPTGTYTEEDAKKDHIIVGSNCPIIDPADLTLDFNAEEVVHFEQAWPTFTEKYGNLLKSAHDETEFTLGLLSALETFMKAVFNRPVSNTEILQFYRKGTEINLWEGLLITLRAVRLTLAEIFCILLEVKYGTEFSKGWMHCCITYGGGESGKVPDASVLDILGQSVFYYCPVSKVGMMTTVLKSFPILLEYDKKTEHGVYEVFHSCFAVNAGTNMEQTKELVSQYIREHISFRPGVNRTWYIGDPEPADTLDANVFSLRVKKGI